MTGTDYLYLTEGDLCILTEDINTPSGLTLYKGHIIEILYRNRYKDIVYVKDPNKSAPNPSQRTFCVAALSPGYFLRSIEVYRKYKDIKDSKTTTKFTHKFNPEDTIWFMENNQIQSRVIFRVTYDEFIKDGERVCSIQYVTHDGKVFFEDDKIFSSKEELVKSLL